MTAYDDGRVSVHLGDCLDVLRSLPDASVDAVVTDPPYGLEFMGKDWDSPWKARPDAWGQPEQAKAEGYLGSDGVLRRKTQTTSANTPTPRFSAGKPFQDWCELWATECLRVLKPGGHMLAFGGTRTWHRLACAVEDAGFEVRDSLAWLHGQGFPKSMSVSKALGDKGCRCGEVESDRAVDNLRGVRQGVSDLAADPAAGEVSDLLPAVQREGARSSVGDLRPPRTDRQGDASTSDVRPGQPGMEGRGDVQAAEGELRRPALREVSGGPASDGTVGRLRDGAPAGHGSQDRATAAQVGSGEPHQPRPAGQPAGESGAVPEQRGPQAGRGWPLCDGCGKPAVTGLGTALKPAFEPVVVARKPLQGTVAANVLAHGTGALNIDGCRVGSASGLQRPERRGKGDTGGGADYSQEPGQYGTPDGSGRWPANVVLDESQAAALDEQSGVSVSQGGSRGAGAKGYAGGILKAQDIDPGFGDKGGASRFFYVAKAPKRERPTYEREGEGEGRVIEGASGKVRECRQCGNRTIRSGETQPACGHGDFTFVPTKARSDRVAHPTVKPLDLMRWLVRLVTPPGGLVLDPFAGSGTTVEACIVEGFRCLAIEREPDYLPLILQRINRQRDPLEHTRTTGGDLALFELDGESA